MHKKTITVSQFYCDTTGDVFIILPSGFKGKHILVNETPTELVINHITDAQRSMMEAAAQEKTND